LIFSRSYIRTVTQYDRLLARYCRLSVCLFVCDDVTFIVVLSLKVGVGG